MKFATYTIVAITLTANVALAAVNAYEGARAEAIANHRSASTNRLLRRAADHSRARGGHKHQAQPHHLDHRDHHQSGGSSRNLVAICTRDQNRRGCEGNPSCEALVCAIDSYCCDTEWDSQCAEDAGEYYECACPGPTLQIVGPDSQFDDLYFVCDYARQTIQFFECEQRSQRFQVDGNNHIGRCV